MLRKFFCFKLSHILWKISSFAKKRSCKLQVSRLFPKLSCAAICWNIKNVAKTKHLFPKVFGKHVIQNKAISHCIFQLFVQKFHRYACCCRKKCNIEFQKYNLNRKQVFSLVQVMQHRIATLFQDRVVFFRPFVFNFHAHACTDFSSAMLLLVSKKKRIKICNTSWSEIHTVVLNCKRKSTLATLTWTTVPWFSKKKKINVSSNYMYNSSLIFEN